MNDPIEHATGLEKRELLAKAAGNEDPFDMHIMKRAQGAKDSPTLIPSAFDARIVGCVCKYHNASSPGVLYWLLIDFSVADETGHEDQTFVQWMWLHQGQPKRCECGYWFKLVEKAPV